MNAYTHLGTRYLRAPICLLFLLVFIETAEPVTVNVENIPLTKATPESQGLDSDQLNEAVSRITLGEYGDINSLLIIRNNHLVLEKYFSPEYHGRNYRYSIRSVTKSFASALIGIAIAQGKISDIQTNLLEFFPQYKDIQHLDSRKRKITLEHVLAMTTGFLWDELSLGYGDPRNDLNNMARSQDWIKYVLDLPMSHSPGVTLEYNSGASVLLSGIIQKVTGQSAEEYAIENLFEPLGIEKWSWPIASGGVTNTGWGLSLTRLDMARFGVLFLNHGRWLDKQIIPKSWIETSTREHIKGRNDSIYSMYAYGYQWWRFQNHDPTVKNLDINDVYFAWGDGGQVILVVPHLNLVVVSTAELHGGDFRLFFDVLRDYIFPAVGN